MLVVRLLGQLEIALDGRPVELAARSAQALFAYLILHPGPQPREVVADLLWPDSTAENSRANLRHALWLVRQALESCGAVADNYLVSSAAGVGFNRSAAFWLDVEALQREPPGACADDLALAVAGYRGELLPGHYEPWVVLERERLEAVFERRMSRLLEMLAGEERWDELARRAEQWISFGTAPEPAYRALMRARAAGGNYAAVQATFQHCVAALHDRLGVGPSPETRQLAAELTAASYQTGLPPGAATSADSTALADALALAATERARAELYLAASQRLHRAVWLLSAALSLAILSAWRRRRNR